MDLTKPFFWMGGTLATDLLEITSDPNKLSDGGFWAVSTTFEGEFTFAKFANVVHNVDFPSTGNWIALDDKWKSSLSRTEYEEYVADIRTEISKGEVYQVNACRVLEIYIDGASLAPLFSKLLNSNPAPHAAYLSLPDLEIASASPELFLEREGSVLKTSPIKGTRRITAPEETFGEKDVSENIMIVDLMRNDLARICESVEVGALLRKELHPGLEHLVSDVYGRVGSDVSWADIFNQVLPVGSISGTPKIAAVSLIKEHEPVARERYCGTLGWIENESARLSVAIRTFWKSDRLLKFGTGAGITWGSEPTAEWEESELKAAKLLGIAGGFRDDGWPYGNGVFETIRVEEGVPLRLERHLLRARASGAELDIAIPTDAEILEKVGSLSRVRLGRMRLAFGESFTVTIDPYVESTAPAKVVRILDESDRAAPINKRFPYTTNLNLLSGVRDRGFDEALIINSDGNFAEGAVSNYVFRIGEFWITPPLAAGVLPGIIREIVLESGLAIEGEVSNSELHDISHAFLLSSLRIAQPIESIDGLALKRDELSKAWALKLRQCLISENL